MVTPTLHINQCHQTKYWHTTTTTTMNTNIFFSISVILCLLLQGAEAEIVERQEVVPGLCEDFYDNCSELAKGGYCQQFKKKCKKSCGTCGTEAEMVQERQVVLPGYCEDLYVYCPEIKKAGICHKYKTTCKKTCGTCWIWINCTENIGCLKKNNFTKENWA